MLSSNNVLEELVLSSLRVSHWMKLLFTPDGWQVKMSPWAKVGVYI